MSLEEGFVLPLARAFKLGDISLRVRLLLGNEANANFGYHDLHAGRTVKHIDLGAPSPSSISRRLSIFVSPMYTCRSNNLLSALNNYNGTLPHFDIGWQRTCVGVLRPSALLTQTQGYAANDVETEQIVAESLATDFML